MPRRPTLLNRIAGLAALLGLFASATSHASPRDEDLFFRAEDARTVLFGSMDAGRSYFVSGGAKQTLTGSLDRRGFVLMETTGIGFTRERAQVAGQPVPLTRFIHEASVLIGYQDSIGRAFVSGFVGPELHEEQVALAGRVRRLSAPSFGARAQFEIWAHPTSDTLLTGTVIAGSARASLYTRGSAGFRLFGKAFVGPEVTFYRTPTYEEVRWGLHVTGLAYRFINLRASAGWMQDDAHRTGSPYAGLSVWIRM